MKAMKDQMLSTQEPLVWVDGKLIPSVNATLNVMSAAVRYGLNVFEGICGYTNGTCSDLFIFRLRDHVERLQASARIMRLDCDYPAAILEKAVLETVQVNNTMDDCQFRLTIFVSGRGDCATRGPTSLMCVVTPRISRNLNERAVTAGIASWRRIADDVMPARVKAGANYLNGRYGLLEAKASGFDEAIFLTREGKVAEASSACLFMIRNGVLLTPPLTASILESITRETIIKLAKEHLKIEVQTREIDRTELYLAEELFICGSHYEITPVVELDRFRVGKGIPGPISQSLWDGYDKLVRGKIDLSSNHSNGWCVSAHRKTDNQPD